MRHDATAGDGTNAGDGAAVGDRAGGARDGRTLLRHRVPEFPLESGVVLEDVVHAYHLDGELNEARDNLVVLFHSLTGTADAAGDWWRPLVGPGRVIDTRRYAVLCSNLLGSCYGTTYAPRTAGALPPAEAVRAEEVSPAEAAPVRITTRDMARLVRVLVDALGVRSVALAAGGSLGGMVALEWAASFPRLTRSLVAFAAPAAHPAQAIGWNHIQRRAIESAGAPGLAIARMVGMMTYRTAAELGARFGRERRPDDRFQAQAYLDHHGKKLVDRFDAASYLTLLDAMDSHDVGRGRGGAAPALRAFRGRLTGVGIPGDLLYSAADVRAWADEAGADYRDIDSIHGHDAFLLETEQAGAILRDALRAATDAATRAAVATVEAVASVEAAASGVHVPDRSKPEHTPMKETTK